MNFLIKDIFNHIIYQPTNSTYKGENLKTTLPYAISWRKKGTVPAVKIKVIVVVAGRSATGAIESSCDFNRQSS